MDKWIGKVAIVTGASAGIGAAVAKALARHNIKTIGIARRVDRIEALKSDLKPEEAKNLFAYKCDVSKDNEIKDVFKKVYDKFGGLNILINNSGIINSKMILTDDSNEALRNLVDTNLMGVTYCIKEAYKYMTINTCDERGYIININSIVGHNIPIGFSPPQWSLYPSTKYGITALTEVIRQELNYLKNNKIRITSISPGFVATDITKSSGLDHVYIDMPKLIPEDISDAILYVLGTPDRVQIKEITIKPTLENM